MPSTRATRSIEHLTGTGPRLAPEGLAEVCPDWRERETFLSGPRGLMDVLEDHWKARRRSRPSTTWSASSPSSATATPRSAPAARSASGSPTFEANCDVGVSILVGGEEAGGDCCPFGCRLGICHTCNGKLRSGQVRDLRTGELHGEPGQTIRTCVNAPEGHIEIEL